MKILITGHLGFVGRAFQRYFSNKTNVEITGIDLKEGNDCRDYFKQSTTQFDLIIHLAAIVGGRETIENEPLSVATDLSVDSEFFNWVVRTQKNCKVVYFSSSAAYPVHLQSGKVIRHRLNEKDIDLKDIRLPDYTYGWSKLTGEYLAEFVRNSTTNEVYVFRPFSGYGADQDLTYPFPSFIKRIVDREQTFTVWGDGTQVRDFIHIDDIVDCVMLVVNNNIRIPKGLNLGTGIATSFNKLYDIMTNVTKYYPPVKYLLDKPVGVGYRVADPTLMYSIYKPKYTLEERIEMILKY